MEELNKLRFIISTKRRHKKVAYTFIIIIEAIIDKKGKKKPLRHELRSIALSRRRRSNHCFQIGKRSSSATGTHRINYT